MTIPAERIVGIEYEEYPVFLADDGSLRTEAGIVSEIDDLYPNHATTLIELVRALMGVATDEDRRVAIDTISNTKEFPRLDGWTLTETVMKAEGMPPKDQTAFRMLRERADNVRRLIVKEKKQIQYADLRQMTTRELPNRGRATPRYNLLATVLLVRWCLRDYEAFKSKKQLAKTL
mgnify:CR=1 FL=1